MPEIVREWSGTAESVRQALQRAEERGQLVSVEPLRAGPRGVAVRVVLRPAAVVRTRTAPRQSPQWPTSRLVVVGVSVGAGLALGTGIVWGGFKLFDWAGQHVAELVGAGVAVLIVAALLARILVGGGGDKHPCNR